MKYADLKKKPLIQIVDEYVYMFTSVEFAPAGTIATILNYMDPGAGVCRVQDLPLEPMPFIDIGTSSNILNKSHVNPISPEYFCKIEDFSSCTHDEFCVHISSKLTMGTCIYMVIYPLLNKILTIHGAEIQLFILEYIMYIY